MTSLPGCESCSLAGMGNRVYGRTLNHGEPDSGEGMLLEAGETAGISSGERQGHDGGCRSLLRTGHNGYAPVANTVLTWLAILTFKHDQIFVNYLLAAARRLDAAHAHC